MLKHYPFANNGNKQATPNALNTIETYSQISYNRAKPNSHKRNASEIIVSQVVHPKASFELGRRGSVISKTPHNLLDLYQRINHPLIDPFLGVIQFLQEAQVYEIAISMMRTTKPNTVPVVLVPNLITKL